MMHPIFIIYIAPVFRGEVIIASTVFLAIKFYCKNISVMIFGSNDIIIPRNRREKFENIAGNMRRAITTTITLNKM